ncbi:MAG: nitroreductase family deazaflavin-dependent oxidoreductase [Catenulispora sp.]|nr:nitroreductase family deazaflavin-dependent oxidoreductase [Catenulispora sp.]
MGAKVGARVLKTRWMVRAPISLYRAGLGFLLGSRLLMLQHRGRKTGQARYVVLEVVEHSKRDEYVVVSGFGEKSQWYRNVETDPRVRVSSGFRRSVPAEATLLDPAESAEVLHRYEQEHPRAWARLRPTIEEAAGHPVDTLPMVRLHLKG